MPINASLYRSLQKQYGPRAQRVYSGMEQEKKPSFTKGLATATREGHVAAIAAKGHQMAYTGFKALKAKLAAKSGIRNPGALAASIGRKKYGKAKFQAAAAKGKPLGHPSKPIPVAAKKTSL